MQEILDMEIVGESNMKKGRKFIVFKKDNDGQNPSQIAVITFDNNGIAHVVRRIENFFENLEGKMKELAFQKICPTFDEELKEEL